MKRKKRGTVIFFSGRPVSFGLPGKFFSYLKNRYERVVIFDDNFSEKNLSEMTNPIIGVSFSAGAIDMIDFVSKFPKKFSFIVMIAPIGTRENVLNNKRYRKLIMWEIGKIYKKRKWLACRIVLKIGFNFLFYHNAFLQKIEKIRKYDLYRELVLNIFWKVDFAFIFPLKDGFMPVKNLPQFIQGRFVAESLSSGHFGFFEMPGYYRELFQDL